MKRFISSSLMIILVIISSLSFANTISYAASKMHVEEALIELEKTSGYTPGETASVTYNCFAFVSDVCEQLYGVTYAQEQQNGNYQFNHTSNYYTVAVKTYTYSSDSQKRKDYAKQIKEWILLNAAPGDVLQYGCADSGYSKKHTVLIQHIDDEKMQFLHSNYETMHIPAEACRLDTIYWDSFLKNPMDNEYKGDDIYSLNLLFGSQMKLEGGMGMSLNRHSDLQSKYYLDTFSKKVPDITKTERTSVSSVKVEWTNLYKAEKYRVQKRLSTDTKWTTVSSTVTTNSYDFKNLTTGSTYQFRVRAYINGTWYDYSDSKSKSVLPPKPGTVITDNKDVNGITISWAGRNDISGCKIYRSQEKDGKYSCIATISNNTTVFYIDKTAKYDVEYYYKVQRYVNIGNKTYYSEISEPVYAKYTVLTPAFGTERKTSSSVRIFWDTVENASSYTVQAKNISTDKLITQTVVANEFTFDNLDRNCYYDFSVTANSNIGSSYPCVKRLQTLPPTPKTPSASLDKNGIVIKWNLRSDINGVVVYRSTKKDSEYKKIAQIDNNTTSSYTDSTAVYGKEYYYKISRYEQYGDSNIYSPASTPVKAKMYMTKPEIKTKRNSTSSIKVSWKAVDNAGSYTIRYKAEDSKNYTYLETTKKSVVLKKLSTGKTYNIYVCANNAIGSSSYSKVSKIKVMPVSPEVTVSITSNAVKLKWNKLNYVSGYMIYRSTSKNGKYELVKDITNNNTVSYSDKNIKYSKTYYYKVVSYLKKNSKVYKSSAVKIKVKYSLSKPNNVRVVKKSATSVTVKWDKTQGAKKYIVSYQQANGKWKELSSSKNSKVIKGLKKGKTYTFKVKAVNSLGESVYSKSIKYTVK